MGDKTSRAPTAQAGNAIYGLGIFGAWVFFWMQASGFWEHLLAIIQGIIWPAFAVYYGLDSMAG